MIEPRKINIDSLNVKLFIETIGSQETLTRFVNNLLEKYFQDRIVELTENNFNDMNDLSHRVNKPLSYVVNLCLSSAEFKVNKMEKAKVEISEMLRVDLIKK
jgi:hypothetical protein